MVVVSQAAAQSPKGSGNAPTSGAGAVEQLGGEVWPNGSDLANGVLLSNCNVIDADLSVLAKFPNVRSLDLSYNPITDEGMPATSPP